jgi:CHAD domain-containing protein
MTTDLIKQRSQEIDPSMASALEPIYQRLSAMREEARVELAKVTESRRYRILIERLTNPLLRRVVPPVSVGEYAPFMVGPIAGKVRKAGQRLDADSPPDALHTLRKRVKRLRYAFEMLSANSGHHHQHAIERLEELQELIGQHHDAFALGQWLRELAAKPEALPGATMMAAGALVQELIRHEAKLKIRSLKRWKQFKRDGVAKAALQDLADEAARRKRERFAMAANALTDDALSVSSDGLPANSGESSATDDSTGTENSA